MSLRAWIQASRPLAQVNIALPLLLGEMIAYGESMRLEWGLLLVAHLFGVLDQLFIVWANDVADEAADGVNDHPTPFSGGSRVLQQGKLTRQQLVRAAAWAAMAMLGLGVYAAVALDRPVMPLGAVLAVALLWIYSFPPGRLSYRGAGAIVQAFGVMVMLPLLGYYMQSGALMEFPWPAVVPCVALGLAGNITTALPDYVADAATDKATWPVRFGLRRARKHSLQFIALGAVCTPLLLPDLPQIGWAAIQALPLSLVLFNAWFLERIDASDRRAGLRFVVLNGVAINLTIVGWIVALAMQPAHGWGL